MSINLRQLLSANVSEGEKVRLLVIESVEGGTESSHLAGSPLAFFQQRRGSYSTMSNKTVVMYRSAQSAPNAFSRTRRVLSFCCC